VKEGIIQESNLDKAVKILQEKYWNDKIADIWDTCDVIDLAEQHDIEISEKEAIQILQKAHRRFDANEGLNWDILKVHIDDFVENK